MPINKKLLFTPVLGFIYLLALSFINENKKEERVKILGLLYHVALTVSSGVIGQYFFNW